MNTLYDAMIGRTLTESVASARAYNLPTIQLIKSINKCIDSIPSTDWWIINGRVRYQVQLPINEVQACVFNAVNDLSMKLIKDD